MTNIYARFGFYNVSYSFYTNYSKCLNISISELKPDLYLFFIHESNSKDHFKRDYTNSFFTVMNYQRFMDI